MRACRVKNYYYDHFSKVHSPAADGKKEGGGGGGGGVFDTVNTNNNIYDKTPKFRSKKQAHRSRSKPLKMHSEGKQASKLACVGDGETIEAKLKALPVLLAIAVNQIITIPDFIPHKCN